MSSLIQDLTFAFRHLRRRWTVSLLGVVMLAIGIGATTAMFSVVDGVLIRALPYPSAGRLVSVWETFPNWRGHPVLDAQWDRIALAYDEYQRVAALTHDFDAVGAAYWRDGMRVNGPGDPMEMPVARGSASLLPMLGIEPALGRWFLPGEEGAGAPQLAVVPYRFWQQYFGGERRVIGSTITIEDRPFEIIGVLPADFPFTSISTFATDADRNAIWTPLGSWSGDVEANSQNYEVLGRLRLGVSMPVAAQEVASVVRAGRNPAQRDARLVSRQLAETFGVRAPLVLLFAAVALLLAITCGNLAALLLGEAAAREREMRTRLALGAGAGRIVRQLLTEHALLAACGATMGLPLAAVLTRALLALSPSTLPRAAFIAFDWRAATFSVVAAAIATLAFGVTPAIALARTRLRAGAPDTRSVSARRGLQHALVASQVALSTLLLVAAGLLFRTLAVERGTRLGFEPHGLVAVTINASSHASRTDRGAVQVFFDRVLQRLSSLPGVTAVTSTSNLPIEGAGGTWAVDPDPSGRLSANSPVAQHDEVLPGFLEIMGAPLLSGRTLGDVDRRGNPLTAVVNETMARRMWPDGPAVGKAFLAPNGGVRTVVGIVADIRERGGAHPPIPTFYESVRQVPQTHQTILLRTSVSLSALAPLIRQSLTATDPLLPIEDITSMDDVVYRSMAPERYRLLLVGFFAAAALLMTTVGIAGVASRAVASQMRELCIRMAIGATAARVMQLVVSRYVRVAAVGLTAGLLLAVAAMRLVDAYLVGVGARDPLTYATAASTLAALAAGASWTAARRLRRARIAEEIG